MVTFGFGSEKSLVKSIVFCRLALAPISHLKVLMIGLPAFLRSNLEVMGMMRLMAVIAAAAAAAVAAVSVARAVQGKYPSLRCVIVVEKRSAGMSTEGRLRIQMRSKDGHQNSSGLEGTERGGSGIGAKLHKPDVAAVVEGSFAARADGLTSRCHGSGPVVEQAPFVVVGTQDDPSRYRGVFDSKTVRAGVEQAVEAVDRDWRSLHPKCSRTQMELSCGWSHEVGPAWDSELIAPC
jgi:hypothetical protein